MYEVLWFGWRMSQASMALDHLPHQLSYRPLSIETHTGQGSAASQA
jgi:hypothetical protein